MLSKIPSYAYIIGVLAIGVIFLFILIASTSDKPTKLEESIVAIASDLGMDGEKFLKDLRSEEVRTIVEMQIQKAKDLTNNNATYTPIIFINNEKITLNSIDEIQQILEEKVSNLAEGENLNLEIFSDFNCPYCFSLFTKINEIKTNNPELFERIVYTKSNLPIIGGNISRLYAQAFEAAKLQDVNKADDFALMLYQKAQKRSNK